MDARLDGIRAKLDRSRELLDLIEADYKAWLDTQPYTAQHDVKPEANRIIIRLIYDKPLPTRLSVLFGEVAHQARSSLDHLVCRLLEARGKQITQRSSFPVTTTAHQWETRVQNPVNACGTKVGGPLAGLDRDGEAWAFIRSEQPFHAHDPDLHPLEQLHELWNRDKHRNISAANSYLDPSQILDAFSWMPADVEPVEARVVVRPQRPIRSGDILAIFTFPADARLTDFTSSGPMNFEVAFGDHDGRPRPQMNDTLRHVFDLVARAELLLDAT